MVKQRADTVASGGAADCRHIILDSTVQIVQLEDKPARARNDRSKEAVAGFDASNVSVSRNRLSNWVGIRKALPKEMGTSPAGEF